MTPLVSLMLWNSKLHIAGRMIVMAYARTGTAYGVPCLNGQSQIISGMAQDL